MTSPLPAPARLWAALLAVALLALPGCGPECRAACRHVLDECGVERPGYSLDDCEAECLRFVEHYEDDWQKDQARDAVDCVRGASCSELRDGTPCYDASIYVW